MELRGQEITSTDATLSALALTDGDDNVIALAPAFASTTSRYSASVANAVDQVTVTPTTGDDGATVEWLDADDMTLEDADTTTADDFEVDLNVGRNVFKIKVTAEDGTTTRTYTVAVRRKAREALGLSALEVSDENGNPAKLAPKLAPEVVDLQAFVPNAVEEITIVATANNDAATVQFRTAANVAIPDEDTIEDGHQVAVSVGENTIGITVTLGSTTRDYSLTVTRNSTGDPLTATLEPTPWRDSPDHPTYNFELLLSQPPGVATASEIKAALNLSNGEIERVVRMSGRQWRVRVGAFNVIDPVEVWLEAGRACTAAGSLCTLAGKQLSNAPSLTYPAWGYSGPPIAVPTLRVSNTRQVENGGDLEVVVGVHDDDGDLTSVPYYLELRMRTVGGTATPGVDYYETDDRIVIDPNVESWEVDLVALITDEEEDPGETVKVELSEAWVIHNGQRVAQMEIKQYNEGGTLKSSGKTVVTTITITEPQAQVGSTYGRVGLYVTKDDDNGRASFNILRIGSEGSEDALCVVFEVLGTGTATPGVDYHMPERYDVYMKPNKHTKLIWAQAFSDDVDDENETVNVQIRDARYCDFPQTRPEMRPSTETWTVKEPATETGMMDGVEKHDGGSRFSMQLMLSDPVRNTRDEMRDHVLRTIGGRVRNAEPVNGRTEVWDIEIEPDGDDDVVVTIEGQEDCVDPGALCTVDGEPFPETITRTISGPDGGAPLTASFEAVPTTHDGQTPFTLELRLSAPVTNDAADLRDHAVTVTGGSVEAVGQIDGRSDLWLVTVAPDGQAEVTVAVAATGSCGDPGTLCTAGGEALSATVTATVAPSNLAPLTARFENVPGGHGGTPFTVDVIFSEPPMGPKRPEVRSALRVEGGQAQKVRRVNGDRAHRRITILPHTTNPITLSFEATADCADPGALCTFAGGRLETPVAITVDGAAPVLAVSDARAEDGAGATLDFVLSLDRAATFEITASVTAQDGTAVAGSDYVAPGSGGLAVAFAPGETEKTVSVAVIEDEIEEGDETMTLRAEAQGAGGVQWTGSALGTGTIGDAAAPQGPAPLTASFTNLPAGHDGSAPFTVDVIFSEPPTGPKRPEVKSALRVEGGQVMKVRQVNGDKAHRRITILPYNWRNFAVTLVVSHVVRPWISRIV